VTPSAVIQVKPGIGDVIWHLPFIRAIAAVSPGAAVTFLAPPRSRAKELLAAETCIAETIYFDHDGSDLRRGLNLIRLSALLRRKRFDTVWILDRTTRPALAAMLAGVPSRIGLGLGAQRFFITNPGIDHNHFHDPPIDWLRALMAATKAPLPTTEPNLQLPADLMAAIGKRFARAPRPWIVVGIGASHPDKEWPRHHWDHLLEGLRKRTPGTLFFIGGAENTTRVQSLMTRDSIEPAMNACDLGIAEAAALLQHADLFLGVDSGPMNLAAAVGTQAVGLFGSTPVLTYSKFIRAVVPDGGPAPGGMQRISPDQVLACCAPLITAADSKFKDAQAILSPDMITPFVSVIIPTRHRPEMLLEAIHSAKAQSFANYEIIVVVNGPENPLTQKSLDCAKAAGCRTVRIEQSGIAVALNAGISAAQGQWIAFLDDDDLWEPNRLKVALSAAETNAADAVFCDIVLFDQARRFAGTRLRPIGGLTAGESMTLTNCAGGCSSTMVKRAALLALGGFDETLVSPDWDLWMRLAWQYRVAWADAPLALVRRHPGNTSRQFSWARSTLRIQWKALWTLPNDLKHLRLRMVAQMLKVAMKGAERAFRVRFIQPVRKVLTAKTKS